MQTKRGKLLKEAGNHTHRRFSFAVVNQQVFILNFFLFYFSRLLCGELYLQPVDGILGDVSCGFNADMHFTALMFLVFITGIAVLTISLVQKDVH